MEHRSTAVPSTILIPTEQRRLRAVSIGRWKPLWKRRLIPTLLVLVDLLVALLIWETSSVLQGIWGAGELSETTTAAMVPIITAWVGVRALLGLYPGYGLSPAEQLRRHTYATFGTLAIVAIFILGLQLGPHISRLLVGLTFLGLLILPPFVHYLAKLWLKNMGIWGKPVVILGYKEAGTDVVRLLENEWGLGYDPVAIFDYRLNAAEALLEDVDEQQAFAAVVDAAREHSVDTAVVAMPHIRREHLAELVNLASFSFRHLIVIPNLGGITNSAVVARDFAGTLGVEIRYNLLDPWARTFKRTLDLVGAVLGGLLISPLLVAIVLLIKLDSPGPAFYGHRRIGAGGKHFCCWKFRTMHPDAERLLEECLRGNPQLRAEWEAKQKLRDDPRVTNIGRLLRKSSLDELPQLWNVLRGEMSLIGPRPIVDAEVPKYGRVYELYKRIRPGMSGLWQVGGRSETSYTERVTMDSQYVRDWSFWLDLILLARTVKTVLLARGAR